MDAQQELYSALLMALKAKYKDTKVGVYDTFLPPDGTPYPFIYLGDNQVVDDYGNKSMITGHVYQTVHVWHDDPKKRGTQSRIMAEVKDIARSIRDTKSYHWSIRHINQQVIPDTTTSQPLLHGVLDLEFEITGGKQQ